MVERHLKAAPRDGYGPVVESESVERPLLRWFGQLFCALFALLFVSGLVLGQSGLQFEGKTVGQISIACLLIGVVLTVWEGVSVRSRDYAFMAILIAMVVIAFASIFSFSLAIGLPGLLPALLAVFAAGIATGFAIGIWKATARRIRR